MNIGFTGSRAKYWVNSLPQVESIVWSIFNCLAFEGEEINVHVGDEPTGVDALVIKYAIKMHFPLTVYYTNNKLRTKIIIPLDEDTPLFFNNTIHPNQKQAFAIRDKKVVDAADKLYAIWDGSSPGTRLTFQYAKKQGKHVRLARRFPDGKFYWESYK